MPSIGWFLPNCPQLNPSSSDLKWIFDSYTQSPSTHAQNQTGAHPEPVIQIVAVDRVKPGTDVVNIRYTKRQRSIQANVGASVDD